jgi:hypothetical protein
MIKKEWFNNKITWWQKIRLWFKPKMMSVDFGSQEPSITWYKHLDGKIYILDKND